MGTYRIAVLVAVAVLVCPGVLGQEVLDLENTKVTDAGLEHLKGLSKLVGLRLEGTKVTDAGVQRLKEALPDCFIRR